MYGSGSSGSAARFGISGFGRNSGSSIGWPAFSASLTFLLKPARLRTPTAAINL